MLVSACVAWSSAFRVSLPLSGLAQDRLDTDSVHHVDLSLHRTHG